MAEEDSEKTLDATDHKLAEARKKGDVPMAPEMRHVLMIGGAFLSVTAFGTSAATGLANVVTSLWQEAARPLDTGSAWRIASLALGSVGLAVGPMLAAMMASALLLFFAQGRPALSWSRVTPQWSRISPVGGLKRLFGLQALGSFARTFAKLAQERRRAAGLGRLTDTQMLALLIEAGIEHETEAYRELRECLETVPASMRGPEWHRAAEHLHDMHARGVL